MADEPTTETTNDAEPSFDVEAASQSISDDLFGPAETPDAAEVEAPDQTAQAVPPSVDTVPSASPEGATPARAVPNTWPKEMQAAWPTLDPKVQDYLEAREQQFHKGLEQYKGDAHYGKSLRDVIAPFEGMIRQHGVEAPQAVAYLLQANARLTQGSPESRKAAYEELGRNLGLVEQSAEATGALADPAVKALQERLNSLESNLTARERASYEDAKARTAKEVEAFASDPAHAYFDEVASDLVTLIQTGLPLQEAYEKAVWANPVTRQKEIARVQTEHEAKLKENARLEALPKKKAAGINVRSRESQRAPTDALGSMEDTMKETLAEIRART